MDPITPAASRAPLPPVPDRNAELWSTAQALEATFLSEMLKSAGLEEARQAFGGGEGEAQFASFLRDEQARLMTEAGGIGLAENLYRVLIERQGGAA